MALLISEHVKIPDARIGELVGLRKTINDLNQLPSESLNAAILEHLNSMQNFYSTHGNSKDAKITLTFSDNSVAEYPGVNSSNVAFVPLGVPAEWEALKPIGTSLINILDNTPDLDPQAKEIILKLKNFYINGTI